VIGRGRTRLRGRRMGELYAALFRISLLENIQYRASGAIWMLGLVLEPLIFLVVWSTVAESRGAPVGGYDAAGFAAYYMTLLVSMHLTFTWVMHTFQFRIQMGGFSQELLRPMHPIHADVADNLAFKTVMSIVLLPALLVLWFAFNPAFEVTLRSAVLAVPALALAFVLRFLIEWTLALAAFWTTRVSAMNQMYFSASMFLSGRVAPLAVLPAWLQALAGGLPFYYAIAFPVEVFLGRLSDTEIVRGFALQLLWLAVAALIIRVVWRRAVARYGAVGS
jgi:ABC-2 type transport system permease protein